MVKLEKNKELTVDDFYNEIELASTKLLVIFQALGYNSKTNDVNWVNRKKGDGVYNMISNLVKDCIKEIKEGKEEVSIGTGMINVEMWVDDENWVDIKILFDLC